MRGRIGPQVIRATVFRQASIERLQDAKCLLEAGRFHGAIYLCGYAIECQLKANVCAARRIEALDQGEAKKLGHDLVNALEKAGLGRKLVGNKDLRIAFFEIVIRWSTGMRYSGARSDERESKRFLKNAEDLLTWLRMESNL
jgi:HEPN domain-containing protein